MDNIKEMARAAKQRLKNNFWDECKRNLDEGTFQARERGLNEGKVKSTLKGRVKNEIKGFYFKVKFVLLFALYFVFYSAL